ncbi:alanyl-tRNA editing protein Aarsd1 [Anthonomus grandis grandis]|uniref:alanyl-tRNA editing protein Aarsd1 n=1 Tax=Anthonomus grandis grandis TaxID=2921223 RepID=UPI00216645C5|nr:alanyl-tRNA editing protein Aarsd1 [Anthonomus grandis grandis]
MVFKCQSDPFLKQFTTRVVSCQKVPPEKHLETPCAALYEVILEDTILFPEGGGQPTDYGTIDSVGVKKVFRMEDKAVHLTTEPLEVGKVVTEQVDWTRRFDHMQQHSGQHLLTALLDKEFGFATVGWSLGREVSFVELDTPQMSESEMRLAEGRVNEVIRMGKEVVEEVFEEGEDLADVRARGLPEDHKGPIRVINIKDIDRNMCCGTHVTNLSQLQMVKLLGTEKSKRKDKILLNFLVGNRVLNRLTECLNREQKLLGLLKSSPAEHPDMVQKLQLNVKALTKGSQGLQKDLAKLEAEKLKTASPKPKFYAKHWKDASADLMGHFLRELGDNSGIFLFLSTGDEKLVGNIMLSGSEEDVGTLGPKLCELLEGKGAAQKTRFQARVCKMAKRTQALALIKEHFDRL